MDADLANKVGKYVRKEIMTYKQYVNLRIENGLRYDIDPGRKVRVFTARFSGKHQIGDSMLDKGEVTSAYDAETGDMPSVGYSGATVVSSGCDCKDTHARHNQ